MKKVELLFYFLLVTTVQIFAQSIFESDTIYHPVSTNRSRAFSVSIAADQDLLIVGSMNDSYDANEKNLINKSGAVLYYEKNIGGEYVFKQKIVPSNRESKGYFGYNTDISGNSMIVGAEDDKTFGTTTIDRFGAIYLFNFEGGNWVEKARFQGTDTTNLASQNYGKNVSIYGDYAIVGDRYNSYDENGKNQLSSSGATFVFKKDASGNWNFFQKLVANDRARVAECGLDVDINGNYIAMACQNNKTDTLGNYVIDSWGAVYIFELVNGTWKQTQKVLPHVSGNHGNFGTDIEVSNDYLVVADRYNDYDENELNLMNQAGAVQIYERKSNGFRFQQKLVASDRNEGDHFGDALALSGKRLVVNANKNIKNYTVRGKSYLFTESGGTWSEIVGIEPAYRDSSGSRFGTYNCLAFSGDDILHSYLSAHRINGKLIDAVYVYRSAVLASVESTGLNTIEFSIYPNPVSTGLIISTSAIQNENLEYKIFSSDGKIVLTGNMIPSRNSTSVEVSSLKNGIYFLSLTTEDGGFGISKFVKQ